MLFFFLGLSSWVLVEYFMHRFVLHGQAPNSHVPHHKNPKDVSQLFVDTKTVAIVSVVFCAIAFLFFPAFAVFFLYAGVVTGYFLYEFIHYRVHHCKPKSRWMKYLRKHHLRHHFGKENSNYSVVFPPLDTIFRTSYTNRK